MACVFAFLQSTRSPIQSTRKGREGQEPEIVTHLSGAFMMAEVNM